MQQFYDAPENARAGRHASKNSLPASIVINNIWLGSLGNFTARSSNVRFASESGFNSDCSHLL